MNRGATLTAAAGSFGFARKDLQRLLIRMKILKRKGKRWHFDDPRPRRVQVMTAGRIRAITVAGYADAAIAAEHAATVGKFVRTNDPKLMKRFKGRSVRAASGREYALETDPNALHRIAALDSPPFHEIYEITSNT